ncbi:BTB/POZ and MATH domain-containing protein 1-like [Panicum miliaceum]|uniref:BTB/POZ and MATH domain-containing protein 1-like n=1 Tax=Panicum miliaceum TaxID=4540 RepID=A0A3L6RMN7_PANMI|nr:BTB/POZ and MATH domain-containing protein 1-like [Panicum miliaceum]
MAESGCIDCSKAKKHAAGEPVAADNAISAGSTAELSITGDFLRQCCLGDGAADVSFLVGGNKFYAHRAVLAAGSSVFKDLLFSPTTAPASSTDDGITVHGVELETFRVLLRFMYAYALPGDDEIEGALTTTEMLRNLAAAADMYGVERLKLACAQKL